MVFIKIGNKETGDSWYHAAIKSTLTGDNKLYLSSLRRTDAPSIKSAKASGKVIKDVL